MQPKTIVSVLQSLSAANEAALTPALVLARWHQADLHIVYVGSPRLVRQRGEDAMRAQLAERVARAADASGTAGLNVVPVVLSGDPVSAIARYTEGVGADLVVVAAGRGNGYWAKGSFAAALGKAVRPPTIAVPAGMHLPAESDGQFRNILGAIDFSDASFGALAEALTLAQQSGGHLRLLHVLDGFPYDPVYSGARGFRLMNDFRARVAQVNRRLQSLVPQDAFDWADVEVTTVSGEPHNAILSAASEQPTDLIVLGLPKRPRFDEFIAGSTVQKVLRRAKAPVLLVPGRSTAVTSKPAGERERGFAHDPRPPGSRDGQPIAGLS